jgi:hypothetical protein
MASYFCPQCDIRYPSSGEYLNCHGCKALNTFRMDMSHDKDWQRRVEDVINPPRLLGDTKEQRWRLECLVRAYGERVTVIDQEEVDGLMRLASSYADLRTMCKAFEAGCSLGQAMGIFL